MRKWNGASSMQLRRRTAFACFILGSWSLEHWRRRMQYKVRLLVILAATAAATVSAAIAGPKTEPGECGKYMYWQEGECTDARDRKSTKSWADEMLAKQWKP
jgi:hypothetical protein